MGRLRSVFVGSAGVRAGWRLLLFFILGPVVVGGGVQAVVFKGLGFAEPTSWSATTFLVLETIGGMGIVATLAGAMVMARLEGRGVRDYGLPLGETLGWRFWEGAAFGAVAVALLVLSIWLAGGVSYSGLALGGGELVRSALLWAAAMLALGLAEEFAFRGYPMCTLATGLGFWPASVFMSLLFGALHYFGKPMESVLDGVSVTLIGLLLCLTLRRTGSLWFAIGFHAAFDYFALVLFASPNSGNEGRSVPGHLLAATFYGPAWLTGGRCGIEASAFALVVVALLFVAVDRRFPAVAFPASEKRLTLEPVSR